MGDIILNALKIERKDTNVYTARIGPEHRFGEFLYGGFAASLIVFTALEHVKTALERTKEQHITSFDLQYLKPVSNREIELRVEETRLTKVSASLHVALCQKGAASVTGYVNLIDSDAHRGVTADTGFALTPAPAPVNLDNLASDNDENWIIYHVPCGKLGTQPLSHWNLGLTKSGPVSLRMHDMWCSLHESSSRIRTIMLPLLADLYLRMQDNYIAKSDFSYAACVERAIRSINGDVRVEDLDNAIAIYWTATQSLSVDIVKQLPEDGVKWLLLRAEAKAIKDGRLVVEITIMDEQMNLIAYGKGADMLVPAQRWVDKDNRKGAKMTKM